MLELSWKPRSTFLKGFLTPEECEALIALVRPSSCAHFQKPTHVLMLPSRHPLSQLAYVAHMQPLA